jgi:hypothetical protein
VVSAARRNLTQHGKLRPQFDLLAYSDTSVIRVIKPDFDFFLPIVLGRYGTMLWQQ